MTANEWMTSGGLLSVVIFAIATYVKSNNQASRIYERLDQIKDKTKAEFTRKDVCEVVHKNLTDTLLRLQKDTECIPAIKAGVDMLIKQSKINNGQRNNPD